MDPQSQELALRGVARVTTGYEHFFGLHDAPFNLAPNPRYLFESATHAQALQQIAYAIERREPLIVMTGDIGTGKTLLCRTVLQRLDRSTFVSVINNPMLDRDDLLRQMLEDFGVVSLDRSIAPVATSRHDLVHALEDFLTSLIALDAHAVVMIDEAQHVQPDVFEQIRLLANIAAPGGTTLQIILAGQLDLESRLTLPELRQFQQRVSRRIRLSPLGEAEVRSYIDHRLAVGRAGGSRMPGANELARALGEWESAGSDVVFTPDAVETIWRWSSGLPRVVNLLCDHVLEAAYAQRLRTIDSGMVQTAATALDLRPELAPVIHEPAAPLEELIRHQLDAAVPMIPAPFESTVAAVPTRRWLIWLTIALAVAAVAAWLMTRGPGTSITGLRATPAAAPATLPNAIGTTPAPTAAAPVVTSPPPTAVVAPPPVAPAAEPAAPPAAPAPDGARDSFEIVVASFRTETGAAAVAAQMTDAGLPVRRRVSGEWQQVLAGPFATREEADAAHDRLERMGYRGTQIVPAGR